MTYGNVLSMVELAKYHKCKVILTSCLQNIVSVVARITIDYKTPLRSRDEFISCLNIKQEGIRYVFYQDIYRASDMKLAAKGKVDVVCLVDGKLSRCPELEEKLKAYYPEV